MKGMDLDNLMFLIDKEFFIRKFDNMFNLFKDKYLLRNFIKHHIFYKAPSNLFFILKIIIYSMFNIIF